MAAPNRQFVFYGVPEVLIRDFSTKATIVRLLKAVDVTISLDFPSEDVYGGNDLFPFFTVDKERTGKVTMSNAEFDAGLLDAAMGSTVARAATAEVLVVGEAKTVPAASTYTVELTNKTTAVANTVKVCYADSGVELALVEAGSEAAGKYSYDNGTLTFAVADAGKDVLIDYKYTVADGDVVSVLSNTLIPVVEILMVNTMKDKDGNTIKETITIYKAKASGKTDLSQSRGKASEHALEFSILESGRPDKKMIDFSTVRLD